MPPSPQAEKGVKWRCRDRIKESVSEQALQCSDSVHLTQNGCTTQSITALLEITHQKAFDRAHSYTQKHTKHKIVK